MKNDLERIVGQILGMLIFTISIGFLAGLGFGVAASVYRLFN